MPKVPACTFLIFLLSSTFLHGQGRAQQYYQMAMDQVIGENYDSALYLLNRSIVVRGTPDAYFLRGTLYEIEGQDLLAVDDYGSVIALDESFREAYFKRGELFYKTGVYQRALQDFNHLLNLQQPENTQAIFFKTDPTGQEQVQVTTISKMRSNMYGLRGLTYQAIGDYNQAMTDFDQAIRLDLTSQNVMNRALLHKELGENDLAIAQLKQAVELQPDNEAAWFNLVILDDTIELPDGIKEEADFGPMLAYRAVEAFEEGSYDESQSLFRQAILLNPNDPALLMNAGRLDIKQGDLEEAKRKFLRALSIDESRLESYYLMGNAFFREKAFEEAAAFYEQFLLRDRSNAQIWYNAAMAYFELQELKSACQYLQEASVRGMKQADKYLQSKCNQ